MTFLCIWGWPIHRTLTTTWGWLPSGTYSDWDHEEGCSGWILPSDDLILETGPRRGFVVGYSAGDWSEMKKLLSTLL